MASAFKLSHYGIEHFIYANAGCRALVVAAFVEEFFKERRNYLLLNTVTINLPWARAGEERDARSSGTKSKMHWQTVAAHQASVISDISQVLKQRSPFGEDVDHQAPVFERFLQFPVVSPFLHRPDVPRIGRYGNIT